MLRGVAKRRGWRDARARDRRRRQSRADDGSMQWHLGYGDAEDDEEEDLRFSPALLARRASESWITAPPVESLAAPAPLQRKKSLPDVQGLPKGGDAPMSREEVALLSSARREEVRRQHEEADRLRANPLLYLVSPHVKDWFNRQQLVMLVLFINVSLAIMFFKLLT